MCSAGLRAEHAKSATEDSHAPLHKWFQATHLMCSSNKGISSHQFHHILEVQYNTAWFMSHRIHEAMRVGGLLPPMEQKA